MYKYIPCNAVEPLFTVFGVLLLQVTDNPVTAENVETPETASNPYNPFALAVCRNTINIAQKVYFGSTSDPNDTYLHFSPFKSEFNTTSPFLTQLDSLSAVDVYSDTLPLFDTYRRVFCPAS